MIHLLKRGGELSPIRVPQVWAPSLKVRLARPRCVVCGSLCGFIYQFQWLQNKINCDYSCTVESNNATTLERSWLIFDVRGHSNITPHSNYGIFRHPTTPLSQFATNHNYPTTTKVWCHNMNFIKKFSCFRYVFPMPFLLKMMKMKKWKWPRWHQNRIARLFLDVEPNLF